MTYELDMAGTTMEEKNAALRAAVEARSSCCEGERMSCVCDDEHPVLADPDDESNDVADPLHERSQHPSSGLSSCLRRCSSCTAANPQTTAARTIR